MIRRILIQVIVLFSLTLTGCVLVEPSIIYNTTCENTGLQLINNDGNGLWLPGAFTPNGDGFNDSYRVYSNGLEEFTLTISDGKKAFFQSRSRFVTWDGRVDGRLMAQGTYQVAVQGTFKNGQTFDAKTRLYLIVVCRDKLVPACSLGDQFTDRGFITGSMSNDFALDGCK